MRPDGSIQFPCAFVKLHRGAPEMTLREIYESPEVRKIIAQSPEMWTSAKAARWLSLRGVGYRNSPLTAMRSALDFCSSPEADSRVAASPMVTEDLCWQRQKTTALEAPASDSRPSYRAGYHVSGCSRARPRQALQRWDRG